jgi:hypothetical protein
MDAEKILSGLVRVGTVTDVNYGKHQARVKFQGENMTSGWLYVLDNRPAIGDRNSSRTEYESGGSGDASFASHKHNLVISQWMRRSRHGAVPVPSVFQTGTALC